MKNIALHLLEVCENSIKANANSLSISVEIRDGKIAFSVKDDGKGFYTIKLEPYFLEKGSHLREFGNGLRLLKNDCEKSSGELEIVSEIGKGTCVTAEFLCDYSEDVVGDLPSVVSALLTEIDLRLSFDYDFLGRKFHFDSFELKEILKSEDIYLPKAILFARNYIKENIEKLNGGLAI